MGSLLAQWTPTDSNSYYGGALLGRTFTFPVGYDRIDQVNLPLVRTGSVSGNITISIYPTSGGVPTGSTLGDSAMVANNVATSGANWYPFTFTPIAVSGGAKYTIVKSDSSTGSSNNIAWWRSSSATDPDGQGFYKVGAGSWIDWGRDFSYQAYGYQSANPPTVTTGASSGILETQFDMAGNVSSDGGATVTERGFVYSSTNPVPTTSDGKKTTTGTTGAMSATITGVVGGTKYYVRAYATNSQGTGYGAVVEVTTGTNAPTVTSDSITSITEKSAVGNGTVTSEHGSAVTERGIVWGTSLNPTTANNKVVASSGGAGAYAVNISGLSPNTAYHARAYAINAVGTAYGADIAFTTKDIVAKWGQQFTAGATGTLTKVSLYLKLAQGTSGPITVKIYSDNGSNTPNAVLATLTVTPITNTSYAWIDINCSLAVTNTTKYWIVIEGVYVVGSYEVYWGADSAGVYGYLKYQLSSSASWVQQTDNATFKTFIQPTITANYNVKTDYKKRYV